MLLQSTIWFSCELFYKVCTHVNYREYPDSLRWWQIWCRVFFDLKKAFDTVDHDILMKNRNIVVLEVFQKTGSYHIWRSLECLHPVESWVPHMLLKKYSLTEDNEVIILVRWPVCILICHKREITSTMNLLSTGLTCESCRYYLLILRYDMVLIFWFASSDCPVRT